MSSLKSRFLCSVVIVAAASGCLDAMAPGDDGMDVTTDGVTPLVSVRGVDYSFARPSPSGLHAAGYRFAARYLSSGSSKNLTGGEVAALKAAGVDIVVVWEDGAEDALGGFNAGVADARAATIQAASLGEPAGRPIYFAVDFDATASQQGAINAYFDGAASVLGRNRVGAYGGFYPISRLFDAGKIAYGWQTYAWSGGRWDGRAQLRQVQNGVTIAGGDCDIDEAVAPDYGQWSGAIVTSCNGFTTQGQIAFHFGQLGGCTGFLGGPTTNETVTPDQIGRYNDFQNGVIYWTPNTGPHELHGFILNEWAALGWERSPLGYPITDESPVPDGVGRFNHFQNGSIYWRPELGAHEVQGVIHAKWAALGWERSALGYPIQDEKGIADGGRYSFFQNGAIYFTPALGAHEVHGSIRTKFVQLGSEHGMLGYPISDEYAVPGGRRNDFQHGSLVWNAQTNTVTVVP